jgi:hypothetical protein
VSVDTSDRVMDVEQHDYLAYAGGCRCSVCRRAKAAYMRAKRAAARAEAERGNPRVYVAEGIKHGTAGYKDHRCRCDVCRAAKSAEHTRKATRGEVDA